jgi:hypothetical protein
MQGERSAKMREGEKIRETCWRCWRGKKSVRTDRNKQCAGISLDCFRVAVRVVPCLSM